MTSDKEQPLRYRSDGPPGAPVLVLGPALGTTLDIWDAQLPGLQDWQVIRFDLPGHGGSPAPPGPYSVAGLANGLLAVLDQQGVDRFAYCGISLGAAIGGWLAVHHPQRVASLVLCCTAAKFGATGDWLGRAERVRAEGLEWLVEPSTSRWFTSEFPSTSPAELQRVLGMLRGTDREGYAGCCAALAEFDLRGQLGRIEAPTRVIAADRDPATPEAQARELADGIVTADLLVVTSAAHLANVERPEAVTAVIVEHLDRSFASPTGHRGQEGPGRAGR